MNLTIELRDQEAQALEVRARERGVSAEEYVRQVVEQDLSLILSAPEATEPQPKASDHPLRDIVDLVREIWDQVPAEEMAKLPKDGASQVDHYVYGWPKRYD